MFRSVTLWGDSKSRHLPDVLDDKTGDGILQLRKEINGNFKTTFIFSSPRDMREFILFAFDILPILHG